MRIPGRGGTGAPIWRGPVHAGMHRGVSRAVRLTASDRAHTFSSLVRTSSGFFIFRALRGSVSQYNRVGWKARVGPRQRTVELLGRVER